MLTNVDAEDYAELIDWAARQPWSTGAIGLLGVSYFAMSQWRVAALQPPALRAIVPWEGASDLLREFAYQDGVVETGFIGVWWKNRMQRGRNRRFPMAEDFPADRDVHPLDDAYWAGKRPALERIECPALVCAGWADQGLHTRGSLEGFERIGSAEKWLFTHGGRKWETFYSPEAKHVQRRFLDRYVKGERNGWEAAPRVCLAVRRNRDTVRLRQADAWPIPVSYTPLFLDAANGTMAPELPSAASVASYDPRRRSERASFSHRFLDDTELTGSMALALWVETTEGDDLDVFAVVRKFDAAGREVHFYGYNGLARDGVAKGWLRASHRERDPMRSRPGRPFHTHRVRLAVQPGEIVPLEIEILASSTLFEAGSTLRLDVLGTDAERYPAFRHGRTVNRGRHCLHTGAACPSKSTDPDRKDDRCGLRQRAGSRHVELESPSPVVATFLEPQRLGSGRAEAPTIHPSKALRRRSLRPTGLRTK